MKLWENGRPHEIRDEKRGPAHLSVRYHLGMEEEKKRASEMKKRGPAHLSVRYHLGMEEEKKRASEMNEKKRASSSICEVSSRRAWEDDSSHEIKAGYH